MYDDVLKEAQSLHVTQVRFVQLHDSRDGKDTSSNPVVTGSRSPEDPTGAVDGPYRDVDLQIIDPAFLGNRLATPGRQAPAVVGDVPDDNLLPPSSPILKSGQLG